MSAVCAHTVRSQRLCILHGGGSQRSKAVTVAAKLDAALRAMTKSGFGLLAILPVTLQ